MGKHVPSAYTGVASWADAVNTASTGGFVGGGRSYGSLYVSTSAATVVAGASTPLKATGTTTAGACQDFTASATNRLTYNGTETATFQVTAAFSVTAADTNQVFNFGLAKSGSYDATTEVTRKIVVASEEGAAALSVFVELASGAYVEFWVENETSGANCEVTKLLLTAVEVS